MSQSIDSQGWDRFKNIIRGLYMTKGNKLDGPEGVIKIMKTQHGFKKTKAQYEKQLKDWGFKKNRTKRDWEIMDRKIQLRKRTGKQSDVYLDGKLMPLEKLRKEIARQGYMTTVERNRVAFETPPQMPRGFDIRTPLAQPFFRLAFENLPVFQFQESAQAVYAGSIAPFDTSTSALAMMFQSLGRKNDNGIPPILHSLLPTSAFLEEPRAIGLAIQRAEDIGQTELLNLATFIISNNFPGSTNARKLREWLKTHSTTPVLEALSSLKGPTPEALLENLFRFAINDEDISTVKYLLQAGVNPNGHKCQHPRMFIGDHDGDLTSLQFSLIRGNTELALELIKAGSAIDQPNTGWKSSAIVLAIIGYKEHDDDTEAYEAEDTGYIEYPQIQEESDSLFNLVFSLINAGAAVNLSQPRLRQSEMGKRGLLGLPRRRQAFSINLNEVHTPLSAASKYQKKDLVDLLIQNGADATLLTGQGTSALHECLYSRDEIADYLMYGSLLPLQYQVPVSSRYKSLDAILDVARSLIKAGANVHEEFNCRTIYPLDHRYSGPESHIIFDLGVLTGSIELVNMLISAGADMTDLSMKYAFRSKSLDYLEILDLLNAISLRLETGANMLGTSVEFTCRSGHLEVLAALTRLLGADDFVSTNAAMIAAPSEIDYLQPFLTERQNIRIKEAALLNAIRYGNWSMVEYLFRDGTFTCENVLHDSTKLTKAIEDCCRREGNIGTLHLILQNSLECQLSLSPWFGDSLYFAILNRRGEVIDALLSAGADVNAMTAKGQTPLFAASMTKNNEILDRLMEMGAILNPKAPRSTACFKIHSISGDALVAAIQRGHYDVVKHLLERGADIEACGGIHLCHCIRPLTAAIMAGKLDLVQDLIQRGVQVNSPLDYMSEIRMTPLYAAILTGNTRIVDLIISEGANPYDRGAIMEFRRNSGLRSTLLEAMHSSKQPGNIECIRSALDLAIQLGDLELTEVILCGPLKDIKSGLNLSFALDNSMPYSNRVFDIIRMLLSYGADPNTICNISSMNTICLGGIMNGRSALDMATRVSNSPMLVKILLEAGAKADTGILFGRRYSPVQSAVKNRNNEIAQMLLDHGSNPNSVSIPNSVSTGDEHEDDYRTPLQIAVQNQDIEMIRILFQYKADANGYFINDETNSDKYKKSRLPRTPLQEASLEGRKDIIELLLEHGADVNSPPVTGDGATALQYAAIQGLLGIAHLLLEHDADVNAPPAKADGRTALEGAAEHGRLDMVQLLLNAGANVFGDGQVHYENALRRASGNGHHAIRRMLENGIVIGNRGAWTIWSCAWMKCLRVNSMEYWGMIKPHSSTFINIAYSLLYAASLKLSF
ncbi:hypothetical protein VF21_08718 [Pseudogymnoascus sp. 05NY08]|nr:hypothetical protein VF21_08718 [Pseudogymnoascus sp. 05NY08]